MSEKPEQKEQAVETEVTETTETEEVIEEVTEEPVKTELEVVRDELSNLKNEMLKDRAELENFKRRSNEERIKERKYAQQFILLKLIDLHDNFERALQHDTYESVSELKEGLKAIMNQMNKILEEESVKEVDALHKAFDPNTQQAVMTDQNDEFENEIVTEILQTGYMYKDRILRPAMVKVNNK